MMHADATAHHLAIARLAVFGIWFLHIAATPVLRYRDLPPAFVEPVGIMRLLPVETLMSSSVALLLLQFAALAMCLACVLGLRPWRPIALVAFVLILWHDGAMKSTQGLVNHAQLASLYAALLLAFAPATDAVAVRRRRQHAAHSPAKTPDRWRYGGALLSCALVVASAYTFIGMRRLVWGGAEVFTDGSVVRWMVARTMQPSGLDFEIALHVLAFPGAGIVLSAGMFLVTLAEATSLAAVRFRRYRHVWLMVLLPFHVSTLFLMNIFFWENLVLLLVFFLASGPARLHDVRRRCPVRRAPDAQPA